MFLIAEYFKYVLGKGDNVKAMLERENRVSKQIERIEEKNEAQRHIRQRERERTAYVDKFELEYEHILLH